MTESTTEQYGKILSSISDMLDISPSKYKEALDRYGSVRKWLEDDTYFGCSEMPHIHLQGSFRLGTVIRPLKEGKESDFDVDIVCKLILSKNQTNPQKTKDLIGDRLKENTNYREILDEEGRRCWTLEYAEKDGIGFHTDVLPCIPEDSEVVTKIIRTGVSAELAQHAIAITHKDSKQTYSWLSSNPEGYALWFDQIKKSVFDGIARGAKETLFESNRNLFARPEDVPDQLIKTPLQRAIQILKRHRDMRFLGHSLEKEKPISMIITTLSARLYRSELDVYSTIEHIIKGLEAHVSLLTSSTIRDVNIARLNLITKGQDGRWHIPNPVNPAENFADRWHENNNSRAAAFFQWVFWLKQDLIDVLSQKDMKTINKTLGDSLGEGLVDRALSRVFSTAPTILIGSRQPVPNVQIINPHKSWASRE